MNTVHGAALYPGGAGPPNSSGKNIPQTAKFLEVDAGLPPQAFGDMYWPTRAIALAKAMGIPSYPPPRTPTIHPCPRCGKEIFVQFRGCGLRPRVLDADGDAEHECPPESRIAGLKPSINRKSAPVVKPIAPKVDKPTQKPKPAKGFIPI